MSNIQPPTPKESESDESLASYFDRSASTVQGYTGRFEHAYARPILGICKMYFSERPISATFVAIFFLLSIVPILSFLLSSILVIVAFVITALVAVLLASTSIIVLLVSFLSLTLIAIFFTSAFLTAIGVSSYFLIRLSLLVRQHGAAGFSGWTEEVNRRVLSTKSKVPSSQMPVDGSSNAQNKTATMEKNESSIHASHSSTEKGRD